MKNSEQPALSFVGEHTGPNGNERFFSAGLTKREYFAAMAMQSLLGKYEWVDC